MLGHGLGGGRAHAGTRPVPRLILIFLSSLPLSPLSLPPQPGLQCVDLVFDELLRMAAQCETTELTRFPELRDRVVEVVNHMLRKCVGPTQVRGKGKEGGRVECRGDLRG